MRIPARRAMRASLIVLSTAVLLTSGAGAQSPSDRPAAPTPLGVWRGTSVCLVRPSACNDEIVVYRVAPTNAADSVTVDARKIVRGEEQAMGVLTCHVTSPAGSLTCAFARGTWLFRIRNDSLVGELRLTDGTKFRDVGAIRR
jgi:hypothetical protein